MTNENPELLTILLGNNSEKKDIINSKLWSSHELEFIWNNIIHEPNHLDSSFINSLDLHTALLNQPFLKTNIVQEIFEIYSKIEQINILPEIYKHINFPSDIYSSKLNECLHQKNYKVASYLIKTPCQEKQKIFQKQITSSFIEEIVIKIKSNGDFQESIFLKHFLILVVAICNNSGLIKKTFSFMKKEDMLSALACPSFISNPQTQNEQLKFMISNFSRELSFGHFIIILNHPNIEDDSMFMALEYFKKQPKNLIVFNELIKLVNTNHNLSDKMLSTIIKLYPTYSEIYMPIINHPNFNQSVIWDPLSNSTFFNNLPHDIQGIILKKIKNG